MKFLSPLISEARNSQGAQTWSKNRAGNYTKAKPIPTQPRTEKQQAQRQTFAAASQAWRTLTDGQRAGWNTLAAQCTIVDSLGQVSVPSGHQLYVRSWLNTATIETTAPTNAPATPPSVPALSDFTASATAAGTGSDYGAIHITPTSENPTYGTVLRCTAQYSAGKSFISQSRFRVLEFLQISQTPHTAAYLGTAFDAMFGPLYATGKFSIQANLVDINGFAGPTSQLTVIVGAHVSAAAAARAAAKANAE